MTAAGASGRRQLTVDEVLGLVDEWGITTRHGRCPRGMREVGEVWQYLGWPRHEWMEWRTRHDADLRRHSIPEQGGTRPTLWSILRGAD